MIAAALAYATAVALLVGLAAASGERVLAELGVPRRFAWLGAYALALALPALSLLLAAEPAASLATRAAASAEPAPGGSPFDWDGTLLSAWAAVTTLLLLGYAAAWLRLAWLARRWPRASAAEAAADEVTVVIADDIGPAVIGVFRPRVVLPRWLLDAPAPLRSAVVAHELEHIAARDQVCLVASQLAAALLPWNLPLWWFARRLREGIEIDCDARVLRRGVDAADYADALLAVGARCAPAPYAAAALVERVTQLERRIRIMLTTRRPASLKRVSTAAALTAALAACTTLFDPPAVVTGSPPSADAVTSIETTATVDSARVIRGADGQVTLLAAEILVRVADAEQMRISADRATAGEDTLVFEGDVRIDSDRTSITAARAVAKRSAGGAMVLTVEDAKVIRTFAEPARSGE